MPGRLSRARWARAAALGCLLAAAGCGPRRPPDVLLVTIDTLRADHVGAYGHAAARTPNMDALARSGTLFAQATTPFPRTTPALASLLTGLWPHHHGCREVGRSMDPMPTLASVLAKHGYDTRGVSANAAAGRLQGLDSGFAVFVDAADLPGRRAENVTRRVKLLLADAARERPLFLWVHFVDPHFPYSPPEGWRDQPRAPGCHRLMARLAHKETTLGAIYNDQDGQSSAVLDECLGLYDAEIAYVDSEIGRLLELWRGARGRSSVVVLSSDHGENFGEDRLFYEHGPSVHDASLRVPLLVAGAGPAGRQDAGVARLEDVMPTLLALAQVPRESWPAMDGVDLSPRLSGAAEWTENQEPRLAVAEGGSDLIVESYHQVRSGPRSAEHCVNGPRFSLCETAGERAERLYDHVADPGRQHDLSRQQPGALRQLLEAAERWPVEEARQRTARTPRYKLLEHPRLEGGYDRWLVDLTADASETRDASAAHPDVAARLARALEAWSAPIAKAGGRTHTPEQLEQLRALGYIQ